MNSMLSSPWWGQNTCTEYVGPVALGYNVFIGHGESYLYSGPQTCYFFLVPLHQQSNKNCRGCLVRYLLDFFQAVYYHKNNIMYCSWSFTGPQGASMIRQLIRISGTEMPGE